MSIDYFADLDPQKQAFVLHYCTHAAVGKAARACGVGAAMGAAWMKTSEVLGAIEQKLIERNQRLEIDSDFVLMELMKGYEADMAELYNEETGSMLPVHQWPEHWRKLSVGVKTREIHETFEGHKLKIGEVVDARLPDKTKLLELIGKHVNVRAFTEQVTNVTEQDLAERLSRGRKRMNQRNTPTDEPAKPLSFL